MFSAAKVNIYFETSKLFSLLFAFFLSLLLDYTVFFVILPHVYQYLKTRDMFKVFITDSVCGNGFDNIRSILIELQPRELNGQRRERCVTITNRLIK